MNEIQTGGPAFPLDDGINRGMTLRDYFAAKAEVFPGDLQTALILALLGIRWRNLDYLYKTTPCQCPAKSQNRRHG